jgi:hypothetical protein
LSVINLLKPTRGAKIHFHPCKGGLWCATCLAALDPTSLQGRALVRHVSYVSESCLPAGEGFRAPRVLRLRTLPPYWEGSDATTTCPTVPYGLGASNIKESLAGLPVRLDPHVPNARAHVSKAPDVRAIMGLQDVQLGSIVNVCKTCGYSAAAALLTTRLALLQCRATRQHGAMMRTEHDATGRQDKACTTSLKTSFATPSH